jgi:hypothetical protein
MLLTNIHIFMHVRLNFFHGVKSHGVENLGSAVSALAMRLQKLSYVLKGQS